MLAVKQVQRRNEAANATTARLQARATQAEGLAMTIEREMANRTTLYSPMSIVSMIDQQQAMSDQIVSPRPQRSIRSIPSAGAISPLIMASLANPRSPGETSPPVPGASSTGLRDQAQTDMHRGKLEPFMLPDGEDQSTQQATYGERPTASSVLGTPMQSTDMHHKSASRLALLPARGVSNDCLPEDAVLSPRNSRSIGDFLNMKHASRVPADSQAQPHMGVTLPVRRGTIQA